MCELQKAKYSQDWTFSKVDNIFIFSASKKEHLQHLHMVLLRLQENGLVIQYGKCSFTLKRVEILGAPYNTGGLLPPPLAPLYKVLKGKPKAVIWGPSQEATFTFTKNALAKATTLSFPSPGHSLLLSLDTSDVAIRDILEQIIHGHPRPLAFFLRCHLSVIAKFNCILHPVPGKYNSIADTISRISIDALHLGLDYKQLGDKQQQDPELNTCKTSLAFLFLDDTSSTSSTVWYTLQDDLQPSS
ncbi:uncharacterized protein LOC135221130 [Macrobrachium nipponense]|uniref:uncharacterized protein LOC135221130 n=1 Tax=Macrobrachium nipponense TaxID=159736 RepID=UPI0030C7DD10